MNTAESAAAELVSKAARQAGEKLKEFERQVSILWSEANSIPSGCGGTPFRSDARWHESRLYESIKKFRRLYGQKELDKLNLTYGLRKEKR
jgi:hypothetical protein